VKLIAPGIGKTGGGRVGRRGVLVCRRRRRYGRRRLCVLAGASGNGRVHALLLRRRRGQDRRRACRLGTGAGVSPPASAWPAAALRVGGHGGRGTRARASAPPPSLERPAPGVSGAKGRCRGAAGVGIAGGGSPCWGGRRARDSRKCFCSAAGIGKTGGRRVGRGGALSWRRRREYRRRPLCVLGGAAGKRRVHELVPRRRRWKDRRRACRVRRCAGVMPPASAWPATALRVGGRGRQGTRARACAPPPALARPAAGVSGEEGRWCDAAGVCMAGDGSACWGGGRARDACTSLCPAAGVGETGGRRVGWGGALSWRRRREYRRRRLCVLGGGAGKGRVHVLVPRRRPWKHRRPACRVGRGAVVAPPA